MEGELNVHDPGTNASKKSQANVHDLGTDASKKIQADVIRQEQNAEYQVGLRASNSLEINNNSGVKLELAQATPVSLNPIDAQQIHIINLQPIDATNVQAINSNEVQAINSNEVHGIYEQPINVDAREITSDDILSRKIHEPSNFIDYNARRQGQADPIKAYKALIDIDNSLKNLNTNTMSGSDIIQFYNFKTKLDNMMKQALTDETQLKSVDLATFLNDLQAFSKEQIQHYTEKDLNRSSWQKIIDAVQDFFDILFGYDIQPTVVAQPVLQELISQENKPVN